MRTQFGATRSSCACDHCRSFCRVMPGFLIPDDLARMIPEGAEPLAWAETNLRASPGAIVKHSATGRQFRIPTLVPARQANGSCINFTTDERCAIHEDAPFGCAFFGHNHAGCSNELSAAGLRQVMAQPYESSLYYRIWAHLAKRGLKADAPEVLRKRLK